MGMVIKFRGMVDGEMIYQDSAHSFNIRAGGDAECLHWLGFDLMGVATVDNLMQFTGLTDINGLEIYEGDVVSVPGVGNAEVKICPYHGVTYTGSDSYVAPHADCAAELDYPTVIGNIYENPELLQTT